jgi:protoheme IX farnesyltransferase
VYGNSIAVIAGFLYGLTVASFDMKAFFAVIFGTGFVMAGACVFNNITDRFIDAKMERTKKRALVTGAVSVQQALLYGTLLLLLGFVLLAQTNFVTVLIGAVGVLDYVVLYAWAKRAGSYGTLVGTISGSTPPLAGFTAATGTITHASIILFFMMAFWQMAHFYAIAIYRLKDYRAAHIPVLPAVRSIAATRQQILVYIVLFALSSAYMAYFDYAPWWYALILIAVCAAWMRKTLTPIAKQTEKVWARSVFMFSLIVLLAFCAATALVGVLAYFLP